MLLASPTSWTEGHSKIGFSTSTDFTRTVKDTTSHLLPLNLDSTLLSKSTSTNSKLFVLLWCLFHPTCCNLLHRFRLWEGGAYSGIESTSLSSSFFSSYCPCFSFEADEIAYFLGNPCSWLPSPHGSIGYNFCTCPSVAHGKCSSSAGRTFLLPANPVALHSDISADVYLQVFCGDIPTNT
jgi:hypothetical protein